MSDIEIVTVEGAEEKTFSITKGETADGHDIVISGTTMPIGVKSGSGSYPGFVFDNLRITSMSGGDVRDAVEAEDFSIIMHLHLESSNMIKAYIHNRVGIDVKEIIKEKAERLTLNLFMEPKMLFHIYFACQTKMESMLDDLKSGTHD